MLAETEQLIRTNRDVEQLVAQARYASEKAADKLTSEWGEESRYLAEYDMVLTRLHELGHSTIVRLVKQEHSHRLSVMGLRTTVDRLADEANREEAHYDER